MPINATPVSGGPATGRYADEQDLNDLFGAQNVARWSQLDNALTTADENRIARALAHADAEIDGFFRGGPYAVPLTVDGDRAVVTGWAATIAGVWLFSARGYRDPAEATRFAALLADAYADMAKYKAGIKRMTAQLARFPSPTAAEGV